LAIASFSISGFPLLSGYGAKILTMENLRPWQVIGMNLAALGTAISFAKFIFLPHQSQPIEARPALQPSFWIAMLLLVGGLFAANVVYYDAYSWDNIVKPLAIIGLVWVAYWAIFRHLAIKLPRLLEQFDHLIGFMGLNLILLFWIALA
jgi:multicomponent Na+:H+ antiporter subunit D